MPDAVTNHAVSRAKRLEARRRLLAREKEETRLRHAVNVERLALPWVRIDKADRFPSITGEKTLGDLCNERSSFDFVQRHDEYECCASAGCCHAGSA